MVSNEKPGTPAALPRNREADAWRERAERAENALWTTRIAVFPAGLLCVLSVLAVFYVQDQRDAARAQVAAAEQRAERVEAALRGGIRACGTGSYLCAMTRGQP